MTVERRTIIVAIVVAAIGALLSLAYQHYRGPSVLKPSVRDSVAVLTASKTPDSVEHARVLVRADAALAASVRESAQSRTLERTAIALRRLADSARTLAAASLTAGDSARHYRVAYEAEHARGDSLEGALSHERLAADSARAAAAESRHADSLSQFRLGRVERLNVDLVKEVERISSCRIVPYVPCPSRKVTAIGAALIMYAVARR